MRLRLLFCIVDCASSWFRWRETGYFVVARIDASSLRGVVEHQYGLRITGLAFRRSRLGYSGLEDYYGQDIRDQKEYCVEGNGTGASNIMMIMPMMQ